MASCHFHNTCTPTCCKHLSGLWIFLFWLLSLSANAQVQSSDAVWYTTRSGLPHEHIYCLAQDSVGYIWIGTNNGLVRYDGLQFENMAMTTQAESHSYENAVGALFSDSCRMWVGTIGGVLGYFKLPECSWVPIPIPPDSKGKPYAISSLLCQEDELFVGTSSGTLLHISLSSQQTKTIELDQGLITSLDIWEQELLVSNSNTTLSIPLADTKKGESITSLLDTLASPPILNGNTLLQLDIDSIKCIKAHTRKVYRRKRERPGSKIKTLASNGLYVAVNEEQLLVYDSEANLIDQIDLDRNALSFDYSMLTSALCCQNGVLWLGTYSGLVKVVRNHFNFKKHRQGDSPNELPFNYVRSLYSTEDALWIGSKMDGVCKMSWPTAHTPALFQKVPVQLDGQMDFPITVNTFLELSDGTILTAGLEGVWRYAKGSFHALLPASDFPELDYLQVWSLAEDSFGNVWAGTLGKGILRINLQQPSIVSYRDEGPEGLGSSSIWTFYKDHKKDLWAGTKGGLYHISYDEKTARFTPLSEMVDDSLAGKEIWHVQEDHDGNFWIGSTDHGLACYEPQQQRIKNYLRTDGLSNETVAGLQFEKGTSRLWISTMDGLFAFDTKKENFKQWRIEDGLLSNEFNFKAFSEAPNGDFYLGSKSGLLQFNPKDIQEFEGEYRLEVRELRVNNQSRPRKALLNLEPNERNFSATFALLEYATTATHRFRHRIINFNKQWTYADKGERKATYTNLPPGEYLLEIEASLGQEWDTVGKAQLPIKVPARITERMGFWVLLITLGLSLAVLWQRNRVKRIREKARTQVAIADLERRMLTAQMSPHFLFNSMNAIQQFVLSNEGAAAQEYLAKFSRLIRMFLEASRKKLISLSDEMELLRTYIDLEQVRFDHRFTVQYHIDTNLVLDEIEIPTSLIQPFVENAILHGLAQQQHGILQLKLEQKQHLLVVTIEDNGPGREARKAQQQGLRHTPQGMSLANELAHSYTELDGFPTTEISIIDKKDENSSPCGTRVIINIATC